MLQVIRSNNKALGVVFVIVIVVIIVSVAVVTLEIIVLVSGSWLRGRLSDVRNLGFTV